MSSRSVTSQLAYPPTFQPGAWEVEKYVSSPMTRPSSHCLTRRPNSGGSSCHHGYSMTCSGHSVQARGSNRSSPRTPGGGSATSTRPALARQRRQTAGPA